MVRVIFLLSLIGLVLLTTKPPNNAGVVSTMNGNPVGTGSALSATWPALSAAYTPDNAGVVPTMRERSVGTPFLVSDSINMTRRAVFIDTNAQAILRYGDTINGEITENRPLIVYTFDGVAGDVIVAEMRSVDRSLENLLDAPRLVLQNEDGETLADTLTQFPLDDATLIAQLPGTDRYQLIATRDESMIVPSIGAYTLALLRAETLSAENPISATITTDDSAHYYVIDNDESFSLEFIREGDYAPQIAIGRLKDDPDVMQDLLAVGYGRGLTRSILGEFLPDGRLLITLSQHPDEYYAASASADYTLRLLTAEMTDR